MRIPPLKEVSLPDFFTSENFIELMDVLKKEFDFVICDTLLGNFDAKIISEFLINTFTWSVTNYHHLNINLFLKEISSDNTVQFFYNRFNLYFNFLWLKYQYPYYSKNYYYEYSSYGQMKKI